MIDFSELRNYLTIKTYLAVRLNGYQNEDILVYKTRHDRSTGLIEKYTISLSII